jgi:DNA repair protein RadC
MTIKPSTYPKEPITTPEAAARIGQAILLASQEQDRDKEHFWVIGINTRGGVKYVELVSLGTLNASLVHPREVFRFAIMQASSSIILMHNHPSGDTDPSPEDLSLTRRMCECGDLLGIKVLDHVIIGNGDCTPYGFVSLKEMGHIL